MILLWYQWHLRNFLGCGYRNFQSAFLFPDDNKLIWWILSSGNTSQAIKTGVAYLNIDCIRSSSRSKNLAERTTSNSIRCSQYSIAWLKRSWPPAIWMVNASALHTEGCGYGKYIIFKFLQFNIFSCYSHHPIGICCRIPSCHDDDLRVCISNLLKIVCVEPTLVYRVPVFVYYF